MYIQVKLFTVTISCIPRVIDSNYQ